MWKNRSCVNSMFMRHINVSQHIITLNVSRAFFLASEKVKGEAYEAQKHSWNGS